MKLLSDFDGVWTHPAPEAAAQGARLDAMLADLAPAARREEVRAWLAAARRAALAEPAHWGWVSDRRISAFADEDPFSEHSALLHLLHVRAADDPVAALLFEAVRASEHGSLEALGTVAHETGVAEVEAARGPGVLPAAADAGRALLARGVEIVLVSNSRAAKLDRWFGHAGLAYRNHPERAEGALRVRGEARKHVLAPGESDPLEEGGMRFETARPHYAAILREERPDAIVGDVVSLDLALPLALKRRDPAWRHVRLFWLARDYAPRRMRDALAGPIARGEIEPVDGLEAVAAQLLDGRA